MVQENVCKYYIAPRLLLVPILGYIRSFFYLTITAYHKSVSNSINFLHKSGVAMANIVAAVPVPVYIQPKIHHYTTVTAIN